LEEAEKGVSETKEKAKDCLTPASPFGFAGGREESEGRKPEKNCGQIPDGRDQAAFASRLRRERKEISLNVRRNWKRIKAAWAMGQGKPVALG